ncbi:MAG: hypothetical protein K6U74_02180 [Firmicutes bacterium]|nr:hypothetical protein [Bacillota bacterium]
MLEEEMEKRGRKPAPRAPGRPPEAKPVEVPVAPPAYVAAPERLPVVTLGDLGRTVATAGAGAVVTAVFITSLKGTTKYVGALIGGSIGTIFLATSPIASIPSDLGIGMLAGATGWFALNMTGKLQR